MYNNDNETLLDFLTYYSKHPELRFWQALRNWSNYAFIYGSNELIEDNKLEDTFYKKGK